MNMSIKKVLRVSLFFFLCFSFLVVMGLTGGQKAEAKDYEIAVVVKLIGIPWFNAMEQGVVEAGKQLGVNAYLTGPPEADEAQQVKVVEDLISKGVDAIGVVPNDARSLEPAFKRAREKGIIIVTNESPNQKEHDFDYEMIDNQKFGEFHIDKLVELAGSEGEYAIFVGGLTVPAHNIWADASIAYAKEKFPGLKLVTDRIPCGEDQALSRQKTLELIKAYPNLKGIIGYGSLGPPGAAQAVKEKGLEDKLAIIGTVIPSHAAPYLKDGSLKFGTLWNPIDSGMAMVDLAKKLLDGEKITTDTEVLAVGKPFKIDGQTIVFNAMASFTAENVDTFPF
jgi:simple sugar transport system substrate-binding protein